jgi:hypothetical protein
MKVFENDLNVGIHILNDDSIIVDDSNDILQFYVNIVDENNKRSFLIDK